MSFTVTPTIRNLDPSVNNLLAIDPSTTAYGFSIWFNKELVRSNEFKPKGELGERLDTYYHWLIELIKDFSITSVIYERPMFVSKQIDTALKIGMSQAPIEMACFESNITPITVMPQVWKKVVVGSGNANKEAVAKAITKFVPKYDDKGKLLNDNECDAVGIGLYFLSQAF